MGFDTITASLKRSFFQGWYIFLMFQTRRLRATFLGYLWLLPGPLASLLPLLLVANSMKLGDEGQLGMPYSIFSFSGALLWLVFWSAVGDTLGAFHPLRKRIRYLQIDPLTPAFGGFFSMMLNLSFALLILPVVAALVDFDLKPTVLLFIVPAFAVFLAGICLALPLVMLNAIYQDIRFSMGFMQQALFWTVPILHIPDPGSWLDRIIRLNPLTPSFALWRELLKGSVSSETLGSFSLSLVLICITLGGVVVLYRRLIWDAVDYVI